HYEEAVASYQQAIRLRPGLAEPHNNLGNAFSRMRTITWGRRCLASLAFNGAASFNAANGAINISAAANVLCGAIALANSGANDVSLSYNGALTPAAANIASGNLVVSTTATGNITQAANTALAVGGSASFNAANGAISLGNANGLQWRRHPH